MLALVVTKRIDVNWWKFQKCTKEKKIVIEIPTSKGYTTHILFADEIGTTPEEAVINQVTM